MPPDVHQINASECVIHTFKDHLLAILDGIDPDFPNYLWDKLLPQTELTIKLLCQDTIAPHLSDWDYFNGRFNYDVITIGPFECLFFIHINPNN